jgi:hypothetical protein
MMRWAIKAALSGWPGDGIDSHDSEAKLAARHANIAISRRNAAYRSDPRGFI